MKSKSKSTSTSTSTSVSASKLTTSEPILSPSPIPETTSSLASELTSPPFCSYCRHQLSANGHGKYIALKTKRLLLEKGQYCCEYFDPHSNKRCASKYQLQLDHIQPWSLGGSNEIENLRVLCRKHNNLMAVNAGFKIPKQIGFKENFLQKNLFCEVFGGSAVGFVFQGPHFAVKS